MAFEEAFAIAQNCIEESRPYLPQVAPAERCLEMARKLLEEGNTNWAWLWVKKSFCASVGILHPDYKRVAQAARIAVPWLR